MEKSLIKNKEWLIEKYEIERLTACDIGRLIGVCHSEVLRHLRKFSIPTRTKDENRPRGSKCHLSSKSGKPHPMKGRTGSSHPMFGVTHSKEWKKASSERNIGNKNSFWNGGTRTLSDGRVTIRTGVNQYKFRYRILTEAALGRVLKNKEIIHHIDENKSNDSLSNLFVFRNSAAHTRWHAFLKRNQLNGRILESNLQQN